jgi:threonylcarbamoyladenosine tRNA methylthiotransferase MtaB
MIFSVKTFGCRLNRAESASVERALAGAGWREVPFGDEADVVLLHTCAVTGVAENECVRAVRTARARHPGSLLVVTGCAVEAAGVERLKALGADWVLPRAERDALAARLLAHFRRTGGSPVLRDEGPGESPGNCPSEQSFVNGRDACSPKRALLKVQDGCGFFCTYCIVPYTRGKPTSRPFEECVEEARGFIRAGFREIVVTGCNIACYADRGRRFAELVKALAALPDIGRIRIGSLEPGMDELGLARVMAGDPHVCAFLHLPIQSGDDGVLKRMGRHYTADSLRRTLDAAVGLVPRIGLGADIITGFPGEDEAAFGNTRALIEAYPFNNIHVFPYSERPGTPAAGFDGKVPVHVRRERANELIALRKEKRAAFARRCVGETVEVLVEKVAGGVAHGWTAEYLPCGISGASPEWVGKLVRAVAVSAEGEALAARGALE